MFSVFKVSLEKSTYSSWWWLARTHFLYFLITHLPVIYSRYLPSSAPWEWNHFFDINIFQPLLIFSCLVIIWAKSKVIFFFWILPKLETTGKKMKDVYVKELIFFPIYFGILFSIWQRANRFLKKLANKSVPYTSIFLSNCHSPNSHSCAFSIVTCDRKNEEKMRVGSTNISPNIGYSGRKEPWKEISTES